MNKSDLKNFAINARLALLQRVADRATLYGIDEEKCQSRAIVPSSAFHMLDGSVLSAQEVGQRNALIARISKIGYRQTMEEAAYTWFNRLIAIRYMQQHSLLPVSMRVLPEAPGALPQILREAQDVSLPGVEPDQVLAMLDANRTDALYRYLLIALCNALGGWLPGMFQQITSVAELLFPAALLKADSVLGEMARLDDDCWNEIEIIGWLYQYYITDINAMVYDGNMSKNKIPKELLPAATQIFTPKWVVQYMSENSLGRLWLEGHPNETLRMKWRYYMDEAPQEPAVAARLAQIRAPYAALQPDQLTVLDPCMGSGHILVYAFDVLMDIYRSVGYTDRDAVQSIVQNNLYGLDIDDRAAQLAYFAVMMKACEYDRRFLRRGVQPHVCAIAESAPLAELSPFGAEKALAQTLLDTFRDAKEYGSILHVPLSLADIRRLADRTAALQSGQHDTLLSMADNAQAAAAIQPLLLQAQIMAAKYDIVITNPPYLGSSRFSSLLSTYVTANYPEGKSDLSTVMYLKAMNDFAKHEGFISFITITSWMFLSSFEKYRAQMLKKQTIINLVDFGSELFDGKVGHNLIAAWVAKNEYAKYTMTAVRLVDYNFSRRDEKEFEFFQERNRYTAQQDNFSKIPGAPVAYWVSEAFFNAFTEETLGQIGSSSKGIITGDNNRFLRHWQEVSINKIGFTATNHASIINYLYKWYPCRKGGESRKWYGNNNYIINWENDGEAIIKQAPKEGRNCQDYANQFKFIPSISWTSISSGCPSFRFGEKDLSESAGMSYFPKSSVMIPYVLSFLNSIVCKSCLEILSPTMNYTAGSISSLPIKLEKDYFEYSCKLSNINISISKTDWNSFETSWDFKKHPMI